MLVDAMVAAPEINYKREPVDSAFAGWGIPTEPARDDEGTAVAILGYAVRHCDHWRSCRSVF
jgi:hypothetical protein